MSKSAIDYDAMPSPEEAGQWDLNTSQRKLVAKIVNKPQVYETFGPDAPELRLLCSRGIVETLYPDKKQREVPVWHATAVGCGLMAQALPDRLKKHAAAYFRARNLHRTDRPDPRQGWASTKPGQTKYHYYDRKGISTCSYQRELGPLHYAENPGQLTPAECCSSCDLALLKAEQAAAPKPKIRPTTAPAYAGQLSLF